MTFLPLVLLVLINMLIFQEETWPAAFLTGFLLDLFLLRPLFATSLFFLVILFLLSQYAYKYEMKSALFVFFASFFSSFLYFYFFNGGFLFSAAFVSALFALVLFAVIKKVQLKILKI